MRYVMVPVPSQYVLDVMRWVLFRVPDEEGQAARRDASRVVQLLEELDEDKRALLLLVAKAVGKDDTLGVTDAAEELGVQPQVVIDGLRAINRQALWGKDIMTLRTEPKVGVLGQAGTVSFVTLRPDIARLVRAAARSASASDQ